MGDETNPLDRLLNTRVPNAPQSEEEARERLESLSRSRQEAEGEQVSEPPAAGETEQEDEASARPAPLSRPAPPQAAPVTRRGDGLEKELWEMDALLQYASELQKTLEGINSATPASSEATDQSGAVRVVLGADGVPERFRVANDWNRKVDVRSLGHAVAEACEIALQQRMAAWGEAMQERGLLEEMERIDRLEAQAGAVSPGLDDSLPPGLQRKTAVHRPPLELLADRALGAQDALDSFLASHDGTPPPEPRGSGADRNRAVALTVTASGAVTCEIDARWAERRSGAQIADALNGVLERARADLARAVEAAPSGVPGVDVAGLTELIADASAVTFRSPRNR
ncbi:hypothetical protein [Actinomadura violacea]|uniref:YbaB/EbfC DNA-binding family protein n=1 Tax=Actinomadura violacea TaxID=2819934 RepID=A0ABS3RTZ4_9ACTN|nr:hypothetical protein [Actinomadura violacea]MBO2460231.1 hypothetical protein [Actinomadura violacea]